MQPETSVITFKGIHMSIYYTRFAINSTVFVNLEKYFFSRVVLSRNAQSAHLRHQDLSL